MYFSASIFLAPYLLQFSAVVQNLHLIWCYFRQICIRFGANLASNLKFKKMYAETAPSNCAIWDEFSEQH